MERINFTIKTLEALVSDKRVFVADTDTKYLTIRVSPDKKAFYYNRRYKGILYCLQLGEFPDMSIQQARNKVARYSFDLLNGEDIRPGKEPDKITFSAVFARYIDNYAKVQKRSWEKDQSYYDKYLVAWGDLSIEDIQSKDLMAMRRLFQGKKEVTFNRIRSLVSKVFNYATDIEKIQVLNPVKGVSKFDESPRVRFLEPAELGRLFVALNKEIAKPRPAAWEKQLWEDLGSIVPLLLFTGQRKSNVLGMKWADIDLFKGLWFINGKDFKGKRNHIVPLAKAVIDILKKRFGKDDEFVFPSHKRDGQPIKSVSKTWNALLKSAKIKDLHLHDLRRTMGSWQLERGDSLSIIAKNMGHTSTKVTEQVYAHLTMDPVRESVQGATDAMMSVIDQTDENPVEQTNDQQADQIS